MKDCAHSDRSKKYKDEQLQVLLGDDPTQIQQQLSIALIVSEEAISRHLRAIDKIHKLGKCVPHDLNEWQIENRKVTCNMLLQRHERRSYYWRRLIDIF